MNDAVNKIDAYLDSLPEWQSNNLKNFRKLVTTSDTEITEDWKWNVPVFLLRSKTLFAMSAFKAHTKYNFIQNGALLTDNDHLFNNGFDSSKSRAIDIKENEQVAPEKLQSYITVAIAKAKQ